MKKESQTGTTPTNTKTSTAYKIPKSLVHRIKSLAKLDGKTPTKWIYITLLDAIDRIEFRKQVEWDSRGKTHIKGSVGYPDWVD